MLSDSKTRIFSVCARTVRYAPPVTENVPLHSKSLCKNMALASGGCKYIAPTKLGGSTNGKRSENANGPKNIKKR